MVQVQLIDNRRASVDGMANLFMNQLIPLYKEYWETNRQAVYEEPFNLQMQALVNLWYNGDLKIIIATNNSELVGFITALIYRPLAYNKLVFHIQDAYIKDNNPEVSRELVSFIEQSTKILGCNEILTSEPLNFSSIWQQQSDIVQTRYIMRNQ